MTKSELIDHLANLQPHLVHRDVESAVNAILRQMGNVLAKGERIEVRGFGTFSVRRRPPRTGRNPRTGETVAIPSKRVLHFKPGKDLRDRVDEGVHSQTPDLDPDADAIEEKRTSPSEGSPVAEDQNKNEEAALPRTLDPPPKRVFDGRAGSE